MSWSIVKKGAPAQVLADVKAAPQASHMPEALPLLIEEVLGKAQGTVIVNTYGHIFEGFGEAHMVIAPAIENPDEAPKEEVPA